VLWLYCLSDCPREFHSPCLEINRRLEVPQIGNHKLADPLFLPFTDLRFRTKFVLADRQSLRFVSFKSFTVQFWPTSQNSAPELGLLIMKKITVSGMAPRRLRGFAICGLIIQNVRIRQLEDCHNS
jgi:hypothetical protein